MDEGAQQHRGPDEVVDVMKIASGNLGEATLRNDTKRVKSRTTLKWRNNARITLDSLASKVYGSRGQKPLVQRKFYFHTKWNKRKCSVEGPAQIGPAPKIDHRLLSENSDYPYILK